MKTDYIPAPLRDDAVVDAIFKTTAKASASGQISAAQTAGVNVAPAQVTEVQSYQPPTRLTISQVQRFARNFIDYALQPAVLNSTAVSAGPTANGATASQQSNDSYLSQYFWAYYQGKFVDRFGQKLQQPQLATDLGSGTLPDADITAALSFLIEYAVDLFDPTPVLGDASDASHIAASTTKFYPAGNTNEPTALTVGLAKYQFIPSTGCGLTQNNASILSSIASASGTRAAAISGLVTQSAGGFGVSLGIFGKLSLGDNQLLANIVKTTATRLATRASFAAMYGVLSHANAPASPASPPTTIQSQRN